MSRKTLVGGLLSSLLLCSLVSPLWADDSSAEIAGGGIQFLKNTDIEMKSERLYVSPKLVQVDFLFKNTSNHPITTLMAFPLPKIPAEEDVAGVPQNSNYVNFKIWINGKQQKQFSQLGKAWIANWGDDEKSETTKEITALLKRYNLPLYAPWGSVNRKILDKKIVKLPIAIQEKLGYVPNSGADFHVPWETQLIYTWQQTFPAGKSIHIRHQYTPLVGIGVWFDEDEANNPTEKAAKDWCISKTRISELKMQFKQAFQVKEYANDYNIDTSSYDIQMGGNRVGYVLTTGNNWKGPIGDFTLIIDKRNPKALLQTCWPNLEQISSTQYQFKQTNFSPSSDLHFVVLDAEPE